MSVGTYIRRAKAARWAYDCLHRAVAAGSFLRAKRAADFIGALENWLDSNAPSELTGYEG